ncbi:hypothetical protein [uncultured Parasphingorhabdus sp.]|uniref:hypothetical protein n=1 Tax=uncultured Parasphingorhabdus sp. TaxID=2709694 RepID=UPI002AA7DF12|nr:hypothetical protein [uncultured Parasphingorhabdus sp.]
MRFFTIFAVTLFFSQIAGIPAFSQVSGDGDSLQYADIADLSENAPIIAHVTVKKAIEVDPERAPNAPPNTRRFYIIASTNALIRGDGGIGETIRYVTDLPLDNRGRAPKIKKKPFIIFARRAPGSGDNVQLTAKDGQIAWTTSREQRIRSLVRELVAHDAPPAISRIASAFHVPGTIIGEGETQIFLETESGSPISITILKRAGQQRFWAVSLGEIVDEAARAPMRNSLLWYRLACFLPRQLPTSALAGNAPADARQASSDYQMVLNDLGDCPRSRQP